MTCDPPVLSIILPIIDRAETLDVAIDDVCRQDFSAFELLISASGATPEVLSVARKAATRDRRVKVLDLPPSRIGTAQARAVALDRARTDFIFIRQDDDLWLPGHLQDMVRLLQTADLVTSATLAASPSGRLAIWPALFHQHANRDIFRKGGPKTVFEAHYAFRRSAYFRAGVDWAGLRQGGSVRHLMACFTADGATRYADQPNVTALSLNSPPRHYMSVAERAAEMRLWQDRLADGSARELSGKASYAPFLHQFLCFDAPPPGASLQDVLAGLGLSLRSKDGLVPFAPERPQLAELELLLALHRGQYSDDRQFDDLIANLLEPFSGLRLQTPVIDKFLLPALGPAALRKRFATAADAAPDRFTSATFLAALTHLETATGDPKAAVAAWQSVEMICPEAARLYRATAAPLGPAKS